MGDSFLQWRPRLQSPAEERDLCWRQGPRGEFFEGAEGDAVGLAEGAVDGASFSHAHLGMVEDERGDVAGMSVAITHEATTLGRLVDRGFENPDVFLRST